jgi:hypothetical protein
MMAFVYIPAHLNPLPQGSNLKENNAKGSP